MWQVVMGKAYFNMNIIVVEKMLKGIAVRRAVYSLNS